MKTILSVFSLLSVLSLGSTALVAAPAIPNPSFEADTFTVFPGYVSGNTPITGWAAGDPARAGINPGGGSPFANNGVIPNGSQVAFIQNSPSSSLSAVISGLTPGTTYKVTFRVNARAGQTPNLKVDIDGNNVINTGVTSVGGTNPYKYFAFDFTATSESQIMALRNDAGEDHTVLIDDFTIATSNTGWSYAAWNDDATSGVDASKPYTHAYNFGSATGTDINGVAFTGVAGGNPSVVASFSTAGLPNVFANDANNVTGGSRQLANDFLYGGPGQSITISGLELGAEYVATIYSVGWETGTRAATFNVGTDRLTINQDQFNDNNGIRFSYRYIATESSVTLRFDQLQGNSIHVYGFSNYELNPPRPPEIANPSFETDNFAVFPGYVSGNGPITGWNARGGHGVNPGTFGGPFTDNGTIPNGTKAAFLQEDGPLSQVINGFIVGASYQIRYFENARNGGVPSCEVKIGSTTIVATHAVTPVGGSNPYREVITDSFVATANSLELSFIKSNPQGGDTTLLIDNVSIVPPNTPPSITVQPQDVTIGLGDTATFTVGAAGSSPLNYQWYFGNDALSGQFNPTLNVPTGFGDEAGNYYAVVSNGSGSVTSRVARLTLRAKVPGLFNTGVDGSGNALTDGSVDPHYLLVVNADSASTDSIVQNTAAFPISDGTWLRSTANSKWIGPRFDTSTAAGLATNNGIYVYRTTFDLTGIDRASVVITGGWAIDNGGVAIRVNGIATGLVNNNGFGALTPFTINAQNASFVDGVNTLEFEVQNVDAIEGYTGLYVGNLKGLAELPSTPPSITSQPQSQLGGTGESITFSVVAAGSSPIVYQWRKGGNNIPNANGTTYTISNVAKTDAGVYTVSISSPYGQVTSADAVLTVRDSVPNVFNTGVDDTKVSLPSGSVDPHWTITQSPDPASPGPDVFVLNDTGFPIPPWLANDDKSKWIAPQASQATGNLEGDYTYRLTFDLAGFDPTGIRLTGEWATDNVGLDISINGISTGQGNTGQFVVWTPFQIDTGFVAGPNTLDFKVNNAPPGINPTGFRVRNIRALGDALPPGTAPFIITQPQDVTADLGETVTFRAVANGSAPINYQWFFGPDPIPGETGATLSFTFDFPDLVGDYSVRISNDFGSLTSTVAKLQLRAVNQPPSFTKGPDVTVAEASTPAAYPFPNWATDIRSGPTEEAPQGLTFVITSDNPGLLSASINPANGLLSVTVTPYSNGVANLTVVLKDDGGTDNGGVDTSAPQTFVVTVLPINDCPVASGQSITLNEDTATSVTLAASDVEGTALTYTITTAPAHGTLTGTAPNLTYTPAANYCGADSFSFKVSDGQCDSSVVTVSLQITCVNDAPTAKIVITPLTTLEGFENPVVISGNNSNACVTLDGSLSTDVDSTALTYLWLLDASPIPFAAEAVATQCLEIGVHTITLAVSDDANGTGTATETVEVITAGEAVDLLVALVNDSTIERKTKRPFIASVKAAGASFDRGNNTSAINQLHAFQNKVRAQVGKTNPAEATKWIRLAQSIIDAVDGE